MKRQVMMVAVLSFVSAVSYGATPKLLEQKFAAPVYSSAGVVTDAQMGAIIFDNSTNEFKGMDNAGAWKLLGAPAQSGAKISGVSVTPSSSGASWTLVPFSSADADYDLDSYIGTNQFTAPDDGLYVLTMSAYHLNSGGVDPTVGISYTVNGGGYQGLTQRNMGAGDMEYFNASVQLRLNAGDVIQVFVLDNNNIVFQSIEVALGKL